MKAIVLAGGTGSRLQPITYSVNKHLLPIHSKPLIYYSLSLALLAGITDILIISSKNDLNGFKKLLGDGSRYGCRFQYSFQDKPNGIAEAFIIGKSFIADSSCMLILGDNLIYGNNLGRQLENFKNKKGAQIFAYHVENPEEYGVVTFDSKGRATKLDEKPDVPKTNYAVPGIYFYDNSVVKKAESLKKSERGELEITDINNQYLSQGQCNVSVLDRGTIWLDTGTIDNYSRACEFVRVFESRTGQLISCLEEIAILKNFITKKEIRSKISNINTPYNDYLKKITES